MPCHATQCHSIQCNAMQCHTIPYKASSLLTMPCPIMPYNIMSFFQSSRALLHNTHYYTTLQAAPPGVLISDICEGKHSYKTFQSIHTAFPWDNPKHSKPILGKSGGSHWNIRRVLMQATASLSQQGQGQIRSERQPVPLLRNQQPQFSSWNKGNPSLPNPAKLKSRILYHTTLLHIIQLAKYGSASLSSPVLLSLFYLALMKADVLSLLTALLHLHLLIIRCKLRATSMAQTV